MRTQITKALFICFLFVIIIPYNGFSLDYPHNDTAGIYCDSCHHVYGDPDAGLYPWTTHVPRDIDDTTYNIICWSCHNEIKAPFERTHSSLQIDNGYGDWTIECRSCHNPHTHRQIRSYGSESYLFQGTVSEVTTETITSSGAGWTANQYRGMIVFPDISGSIALNTNYQIISNTSDTLTVKGPIDLSKAAAGKSFAIIYGKLIKNAIVTPNSGSRNVKFFRTSGANSFADGDGTYDGVCEVCHTQTIFHRNSSAGDHAHEAGAECTACHLHVNGFKPSCDVCHGFPPVVSSASGGPDGLVNYNGSTGSVTAGAHDLHVNTKGFTCSTCHYNSAGSGITHIDNFTVTLGFNLFEGVYQGGAYDGQSGVSYDASVTNPVTSVSSGGNKTCSGIYCHSSVQSSNGGTSGPGTYGSPQWDGSVLCGDCHRADGSGDGSLMDSGSHTAHVKIHDYVCSNCHDGKGPGSADHVDNNIDIQFSSLNPSAAYSQSPTNEPGDGYGTCSNVYCHSSSQGINDPGQPPVYKTPEWGSGYVNCGSCHNGGAHPENSVNPISSGSHYKHVSYRYNSLNPGNCNICHYIDTASPCDACHAPHKGAYRNIFNRTINHVNNSIDVNFETGTTGAGASYSGDSIPQTPYGACSNVYCHSTGDTAVTPSQLPQEYGGSIYISPAWGGGPLGCNGCHGRSTSNGMPDYANGGAGAETANSHPVHVATNGIGCQQCHFETTKDGTTINNTDENFDGLGDGYDIMHVNNVNTDVIFMSGGSYDPAAKTCSSTSCHISLTPQWGDSLTN